MAVSRIPAAAVALANPAWLHDRDVSCEQVRRTSPSEKVDHHPCEPCLSFLQVEQGKEQASLLPMQLGLQRVSPGPAAAVVVALSSDTSLAVGTVYMGGIPRLCAAHELG